MNWTEIVGYVASALVVLSLAMTSVVRLRAISLVGSVAFVVYGVLIESVPIVITNAAIACLNIWFLRAELGGKRKLGATAISPQEPFLVDFLTHHLSDIHKFQPAFQLPGPHDDLVALLLMRDGLPAGALLGELHGDELVVQLDYVTKPYRDTQLATWLYGKGSGVLRRLGVERVTSSPGSDSHAAYLSKTGFTKAGDCYRLTLPR